MKKILPMLVALAAMMSGCSTPYSPPKVYGDFDGIRSLSRNAKTVKIIAVHGITSNSEGWSNKIREGLEKSLQLTPLNKSAERISIFPPGGGELTGYLDVYRYGSFEFYELTWSPTTKPIKDRYLKYDSDSSYGEKRARLNNSLKSGLVDDGLSDAIIYMGPTKRAMQDVVAQSLCYALVPNVPLDHYCDFTKGEISSSPDDQIVFITHSLGSRMVYDTLLALSNKESLAADFAIEPSKLSIAILNTQSILKRTPIIYMLANQLPLIELSVLGPTSDVKKQYKEAGTRPAGFESFARLWSGARELNKRGIYGIGESKPSVVAFSDPNDLLSYKVCGSYLTKRQGVNFSDVIVSNAPTIASLIEHPLSAHTDYQINQDVITLLAEGQKHAAEQCGEIQETDK